MDKFDAMVEALEENEELVECQECFDLFPKIDCTKQDHGYLCPICGKLSQTGIMDTVEPSVFDIYDQQFPDVQDYDPNTTRDYESEPQLGDVLGDLIKDEYEAIDGYEVADETIQHTKLDPEVKDEILDTLDHIKEEEEEHIDELKDFMDTEEDPEEDSDDDDDEEDFDSEDKDKESEKLHEAVEAQTWVGYTLAGGEFVGACKAFSEEEAYEVLEREYVRTWVPMGYEPDELVVEPSTDEDLDETDYLTEGAFLNHKLDKLFKNGYAIYCYAPQTAANKELPPEHKKVVAKYKDAFKAAQVVSRRNPDLIVYLFPVEIDVSGMSPAVQKLLNIKKGYCTQIASFAKGAVKTDSAEKLLKEFKTLGKEDKKLAKLFGNTISAEEEDVRAEAETEAETAAETETETEAESTADSSSKAEEPAAETDTKSEETTASAEEPAEDAKEEPAEEPAEETTATAPAVKNETFELIDKIFTKGYSISIDGAAPKALTKGTTCAKAYNGAKKYSARLTEENSMIYLCLGELTEDAISSEAKNPKDIIKLLNALISKTYQKPIQKAAPKSIILAAFKQDQAVTLKKTQSLITLIESQFNALNEYFAEEDIFEPEAEAKSEEAPASDTATDKTSEPTTEPTAEPASAPAAEADSKSAAELGGITTAFKSVAGTVSTKSGKKQANRIIHKALSAAGIETNNKQQSLIRKALLGESVEAEPESLIKEELKSTEDAVAELENTSNALKSAATGIKNMTSAMKESILNLSPADFADCVDSSRVELWGLEEPEDGVAEAVLIKSYDDVSNEDIQSCHEEMLDLDGMFTFGFSASGKPSLYGWNVEQLRELAKAGFKGISFDNPAYEEAINVAWRIK